jgi:AraC family transcriptional regulator, arabinose operon regulatory protein
MRKKEGFEGQKSIITPESIVKELQNNRIAKDLYVTDIGYYPNAHYHYRKRKDGSMQNILIYCVAGRGWFEVFGKRQSIQPNYYFVIPAGTPHAYGSYEETPWSIYWIHFSGEKAEGFFDRPNQSIEIDITAASRFADRLMLFEEIFRNLEMGYSIENLEYASICLWHLLGSFRYLSQFRKIKEATQTDPISCSIEFMRTHLTKKISLDEIASHCSLSKSHFCLLFKKKTSRTPLEYLTHMRIQQACQHLDFTSMKIHEIARQTSFDDPFYFTRVFSSTMGCSPAQYRKKKKG